MGKPTNENETPRREPKFTPILNQAVAAKTPLSDDQLRDAEADIKRRLLVQFGVKSESELNPGQQTQFLLGVARAMRYARTVTDTPTPPDSTGK